MDFEKRIKSPINTKLSSKRIQQLSSTIKAFTKNFKNKKIDDNHDIIKCLKSEPFDNNNIKEEYQFFYDDFDNIISQLSPTKIKYLSGIFARTSFDELYLRLMPKCISILREEQKKRIDTKQEIFIDFDKSIKDLFNSLDLEKFNFKEFLIISLYHSNPPKRLYDYIYCKIVNEIPSKELDKQYNYYFDGKIYINKCKIDTRTQKQKDNNDFITINDIDIHSQKIIKLINHEFLLGNNHTTGNNPVRFDKIMEKVYGIPITISQFRRIYLSFKNEKGMTKKEREYLAVYMNHSTNEQNNYIYND